MKRAINRLYGWMERNPFTVALVSGGMSAVAVLAVASLAIYSNETFVQKTPCTNATSKACAEIREDVARAEPIRNPCISFQRVTATRGRNCPRDFVRRHRPSTGAGDGLGGLGATDATQPSTAGQSPATTPPGDGTGGSKPPKGGSGDDAGPKATKPVPAEPSPAPSQTGNPAGEGGSGEPDPEVEAEAPEETEQVKKLGLIGNPGGVVGEVTCGVGQLTEVAGIRVCTE